MAKINAIIAAIALGISASVAHSADTKIPLSHTIPYDQIGKIRESGGISAVMVGTTITGMPKFDFNSINDEDMKVLEQMLMNALPNASECKDGKVVSDVHKTGEMVLTGSFTCSGSLFNVVSKVVQGGVEMTIEGANKNGDKSESIVKLYDNKIVINSSTTIAFAK